MSEEELKAIIGTHFLGQTISDKASLNDALVLAQEKMMWNILQSLFPGLMDDHAVRGSRLEAISMIIKAKSRLCYFARFENIQQDTHIDLERKHLEIFLSIYEWWARIFDYLRDNYEALPSRRFHEKWPKDQVKQFGELLTGRLERYRQEFADSSALLIPPREIRVLDDTMSTALDAVVGEEISGQFIENFNRGAAILREYQRHLTMLPSSEGSVIQ